MEKGGGFQTSVKDAEGQHRLMNQDKDVHTLDQMTILINEAEKEFKADPNDPGKIGKYTDVLVKTELPDMENKAIEILQNAFDKSKQFRFRQKIGLIRMAQMSRMERTLRAAVNAAPSDQAAIQEYRQFAQEKLQEELSEYQLAADNYPTDTKLKFEVASRLFLLKRFDEAIPAFQQLRVDPKYKTDASINLGKAFLEAGYVDEAVDTLAVVINEYADEKRKPGRPESLQPGRAMELQLPRCTGPDQKAAHRNAGSPHAMMSIGLSNAQTGVCGTSLRYPPSPGFCLVTTCSITEPVSALLVISPAISPAVSVHTARTAGGPHNHSPDHPDPAPGLK
jgi:tetratricopeptide (TPR) repeat protein